MIFISYRRTDAAGHAGRLFDRLVTRFGRERVFMDVDTIQPGEDFVRAVEERVGSCAVLIVLIGDQWLHVPQFEEKPARIRFAGELMANDELKLTMQSEIGVDEVIARRSARP